MCEQLGVVRQGYYRWRAKGRSERERTDAELTETIRQIHTELDGQPGVRRVWAHPRAWKKTTRAGQRPVDAPDLIGQDFTAEAPNTRWCGDITYSAQLAVMCSSSG
ncbi:MAG: hypothetical protein LC808_45065 [Actinobacteria bacterium]|nr:hypothetical protein [Actinomycetota bacterium]